MTRNKIGYHWQPEFAELVVWYCEFCAIQAQYGRQGVLQALKHYAENNDVRALVQDGGVIDIDLLNHVLELVVNIEPPNTADE